MLNVRTMYSGRSRLHKGGTFDGGSRKVDCVGASRYGIGDSVDGAVYKTEFLNDPLEKKERKKKNKPRHQPSPQLPPQSHPHPSHILRTFHSRLQRLLIFFILHRNRHLFQILQQYVDRRRR